MGVSILRPNATLLAGGSWAVVGGAGSHHAAQSDNSDSTYSHSPNLNTVGNPIIFGLTTFTIPTLAQVRNVTLRVRASSANASGTKVRIAMYQANTPQLVTFLQLTGSTIKTYTAYSRNFDTYNNPWGQTAIDNLQVNYDTDPSSTTYEYSLYETYVDVTYNEAPVVTVTAPTGTQGSTQPTVTWTYTDPEGDAQEKYQIKIFNADQYNAVGFSPDTSTPEWDSGIVSSNVTSVVISAPIPNGPSYRAYVRVTDVGSNNRYSNWAYNSFTVSVDPPAIPIIVATADDANARMILALQGRTNALTKNQSSLETDTTGWQADTNVTISRSTSQWLHGTASLRLSSNAAGNMWARTTPGASGTPVSASTQYTALASFRADSVARFCRLDIDWYNANGTWLASTVGTSTNTSTSQFTQMVTTATSPAGAAFACIVVYVFSTAAAGELHYVDSISLAPGSDTVWTRGGFVADQRAEVERSVDNGVTWEKLRYPSVPTDANLVIVPPTEPDDGGEIIIPPPAPATRYRGFNLQPLWPWNPSQTWALSVYQTVKNAGFNQVRFVLRWELLNPSSGVYDNSYLTILDTAVARAKAAGLTVMFDCIHLYAGGGMPTWAITGDSVTTCQTNAGPYLKMLALRYKNEPAVVVLDFINEPDRWPLDQNGVMAMYNSLINEVRTVNTETWIHVEPSYGDSKISPTVGQTGYASPTAITNKYHVAYQLHDYYVGGSGDGYTAQGGQQSGFYAWAGDVGYANTAQTRTDMRTHVNVHKTWCAAAGIPMMVGEWGMGHNQTNVTAYRQDKVDIWDENSFDHLWWEMYTSGNLSAMQYVNNAYAFYSWVPDLLG